MRILAVNWLDLENPQAGGAEVHLFEILGRLVAHQHQVTLLASGWPGSEPQATVSGIRVRRFGGRHSFALRARAALRRELAAGGYDIVLEDINKLPVFVPALTRLPVYVIVPHLFGTTAFTEASLPVATVVWLAERPIPRWYRRAAFHAISESTKADLVSRGVDSRSIRVILPGVDAEWLAPATGEGRFPKPTFLYVGRLKRYKKIDTVLQAIAAVRAEGMDVRLKIAGRGDDRDRLERIVGRLGLGEEVQFLGFVSEDEKRTLLRRAWSLVFPSAKEGWGIANVEAAACGTPAIASDSPGLRESVRDGQTGILVPHGDVRALAEAMKSLALAPAQVERLGRAARRFAETLSWDRAADLTESHLLETLHSAR